MIAGTATNLGISLLAIPPYGAWGAIAANLASETAVVVIGLLARRRFGIFWHPVLPIVMPPFVCSAAVALAIAALPTAFDRYWWLELAMGAILLAGCLAVFERSLVDRVIRVVFGHRGS